MKLLIKKVEAWKDLSDAEIREKCLPKKANELDAGLDIIATTEPKIVIRDKEDLRPEDTLKGLPLEDKPALYKRVAYIEYGTNLYWTPDRDIKTKIVGARCDASGALCDLITTPKLVDWHIELFPRSSISKYNLVLANSVGTIDTGYQGQILCRFHYIFQPEDLRIEKNLATGLFEIYGAVNPKYIYKNGDAIVQLKARKNENVELQIVDELPSVDTRGAGGFGSSDKK